VGRELASANELLRDEAGTLIDRLEAATKEDNPMLALAEATRGTDG
jgi:hypothetical protein